jgi:hypothetical protein
VQCSQAKMRVDGAEVVTGRDAVYHSSLQPRSNAMPVAAMMRTVPLTLSLKSFVQSATCSPNGITTAITQISVIARNLLGCTVVFLIECRPTFQRYVLPPSSSP